VASKSIASNLFIVGGEPEYSPLVKYGYDSYGRQTTVRYPLYNDLLFTTQNNSSNIPTTLTTTYDSMGRRNGLTDDTGVTWVQNVTYDYAGRPQGMQILSTTETRSYNVSGQLGGIQWNTPGFTQMTGGMTGGLSYIYLPTQNNGQIQQMVDTVSGETIAYTYDALKRLTSATSESIPGSSASSWTETFGYDGFGNLTGKTLNGILQSIPVVAQSNQLSSATYDANGNMTSGAGATLAYNVDNRMMWAAEVSGGIEYYQYAADGKRVGRQRSSGIWEFTFYGAYGERLGVYNNSAAGCAYIRQEMNVSFAGKLIWQGVPSEGIGGGIVGTVLADRLGSNRNSARFYPYGDEITSTANDRVKFGTYTRDSYTGLDYADQRFYASTSGRFDTPDPYKAAGATQGSVNNSSDPGTGTRTLGATPGTSLIRAANSGVIPQSATDMAGGTNRPAHIQFWETIHLRDTPALTKLRNKSHTVLLKLIGA
jgi:RHS repeat-associated protein